MRLVLLFSCPFYKCGNRGTEHLNTQHRPRSIEVAVPASREVPDRRPCSPGREEGRRLRALVMQAWSLSSSYELLDVVRALQGGTGPGRRGGTLPHPSSFPEAQEGRLRFAKWQRGTWEIKCFSL